MREHTKEHVRALRAGRSFAALSLCALALLSCATERSPIVERIEWTPLPPAAKAPSPADRRVEFILRQDARHLSRAARRAIREEVVESALHHSVDPLLILALMRIESGYNTLAHSKAGAAGLLQLRPKTAHWIASRVEGFASDADASLFDPRVNIRLGVGYFSYLYRRFNNFALALEAYNRGPNSPDLFAKSLELQHHTDRFWPRVLAQYLAYRRTAGCSSGECSFEAPWQIGLDHHELAALFNEALLDEQIL